MKDQALKQKNFLNPFQVWMSAVRARTIPIPTIQVLTGTLLATAYSGSIDWFLFLFTWLVAVFITIGTNLINDVFDFDKGGDKTNRVGHFKMIRAGLISRNTALTAGLGAFALALLCSIPLSLHAGLAIFLLVLLSAVIGYCYTGGPFPICYLGLSELFILFFYGGICVGVSFYIQTGFVSGTSLLCALQMGLLAIIPNALNNFRDMHEDAEVNKKTLAVRFGATFAKWEIALLTITPFLLNGMWLVAGFPEAALIPLFLIPIAFLFVRSVWMTTPGPMFNRYFALSVFLHFAFGTLLIIGFLLAL